MRWAHVLSMMNGQQRWGDEPPRPPIWPASVFAPPSATLDLVEAERTEAA